MVLKMMVVLITTIASNFWMLNVVSENTMSEFSS